MKSLKLMKSIESVELIRLIKSSQQKIYHTCTFLGIISVVYILRNRGQNYRFFFSCVSRKQKKNKASVLTLYQDVLIFSLLKDTKNKQIKTAQTNFDPPRNRLTW